MQDLKLENKNPKLLSPLTLAFVGDAVYELLVRERLVGTGSQPANSLHKQAIGMVCAEAQAAAFTRLEAFLSPEEMAVLKRGRNANTTKVPKHASPADYRKATGLEALFGYLYLKGEIARVNEIFNYIESGENDVEHNAR